MGTILEIHLLTINDVEVEGIVEDLIKFMEQHDYYLHLESKHKRYVIK